MTPEDRDFIFFYFRKSLHHIAIFSMTSCNWCFTSFVKDNKDAFKALENMSEDEKKEKFQYIIVQYEVCPDTGSVHTQGFVIMKKPCRFTAVQKIIGDKSAHFEKMSGTAQQVRSTRSAHASTRSAHALRHPDTCHLCSHFLFPYSGL